MQAEKARLQKIISAHGIASRREAERMISAGRVTVNGALAHPGQSADPDIDIIKIDGKPLANAGQYVYIMLNKPQGCITTVSDDRGRKTVMELVADAGVRVYPVGRLDMDSEGLLLLTNDGEFANLVAHPSKGKVKSYDVQTDTDAQKTARLLRRPVMVDGRTVRAVEVKVISCAAGASDVKDILRITVAEGRNRQIRKMCKACGANVISLRRVSIGPLKLGTLETGKWRYLTEDEVMSLREV